MDDVLRDAVQVPPQVVRLREKGQFTVPARIRKSMGIQEDNFCVSMGQQLYCCCQ